MKIKTVNIMTVTNAIGDTTEVPYSHAAEKIYMLIAESKNKQSIKKVYLNAMVKGALPFNHTQAEYFIEDALAYRPEELQVGVLSICNARVLPKGYEFIGFHSDGSPIINQVIQHVDSNGEAKEVSIPVSIKNTTIT